MTSLSDLDLKGKRVLVRVDFNVPMEGTAITDDTRIRAAIPTIRAITEAGGRAILMSHLGRPKGGPDPKYSLRPVAAHLGTLLGQEVRFTETTTGEAARAAVDSLPESGVLVLENTRFLPGEEKNDEALSRDLATLADVYVNDAFGSAHRAHASTEGVARFVPEVALGMLMQKEVDYLERLLQNPERPFVAVLGGAKVSDKIAVIDNLLGRCDRLLVGGAMAYTLLKAQGHAVGASKVEEDKLDLARDLLARAGDKLMLPTDHVVADRFAEDAATQVVAGDVPEDSMGLDIGPETAARYHDEILRAKTVVWNGPMGVFEMQPFASGTLRVAEALAEATEHGALTVVGGGDSVAAVSENGLEDRLSHVSTGGGAMLEFLEGQTLPGVAALDRT
ncbi:MAG TPA: phosphoglycerate kinase [Rhodothermales bacterium]|nr:phosphoglycerate kinase [Rhodothermales bacterium]